MKKLPLVFLTLTMTLGLAACGGGSTSTDTTGGTGGTIVTPAPVTATLTVTVTGVATAPIKVTDSTGTVKFDGTVSGSKTLGDLPRGKYTVTAGAVTNFTVPGVQLADLSSGDGALTLTYTALPGSALTVTTVAGVVPDWKLGATSVALAHVITMDGKYSSFSGLVSPKGTIAADGTLSISLPDTLPASYLYPYAVLPPLGDTGCTFTGTATDREVQTDWYARKLVQAADSPLGYVQEYVSDSPVSSRHLVSRVYSAADSTIKGTVICQATSYSEAYKDVYDLTLSKGWNTVETYTDSGGIFHAVTTAAGTRVSLLFESFTPEVRVALGNASVQIKPGERVTTSAMITQIGGYSGTVALTTNVPGISVEPATLTLSPVTTQSLSAQALNDPRFMRRQELTQAVGAASVSTSLTFVASTDAGQHYPASTDQLIVKNSTGTTLNTVNLAVTVTVPSVNIIFGNENTITVDQGQINAVPVNISGVDGYAGPVELSLENLPDGVSATTLKTSVGSSLSPTMTFTASATAVVGTKEATLVTKLGSVVTRRPINVTVFRPSVRVAFSGFSTYGSLAIHRGQTKNLSVLVSSQHGFNGPTTITLDGLPNGVTASPLTVKVVPGSVTSAVIPVSADETAPYGVVTINLVDRDLDSIYPTRLDLSVASNMTVLLNEPITIATANNGIWTISQQSRYVSGNSSSEYLFSVQRYEGNQLRLNTTIRVADSDRVVRMTTPDGRLVLVGSSRVYIMDSDGSTTSISAEANTNAYPKIIDNQNQLWYVGYDVNTSQNTLNTLDLNTAENQIIRNIPIKEAYFKMSRSSDGGTLYLTPNSGFKIVQIDAATMKTKDIPLPGISAVTSLTVAQDGTLWGSMPYSGVFKVNTDGTLNIFTSLSAPNGLIFDTRDPKILWSFTDSNIIKIDTITGKNLIIPVGSYLTESAADPAGGIWAYAKDYDLTTGSFQDFLSLIK